jgi:hypothetical protein
MYSFHFASCTSHQRILHFHSFYKKQRAKQIWLDPLEGIRYVLHFNIFYWLYQECDNIIKKAGGMSVVNSWTVKFLLHSWHTHTGFIFT